MAKVEFKVNGKITKIGEVLTGGEGEKAWKKIEFVIDTGDQYDNLYVFSIFGAEKVDKFLQYRKVGDNVDVSFNVKTREWNDRYFTNLDAWKVWGNGQAEQPSSGAAGGSDDEEDDLPF